MSTTRRTAALVAALTLTWGLAACGAGGGQPTTTASSAGSEAGTPTPSPTPEPTPTPTAPPTVAPTPPPGTPPADALPAGFPDPASLIGKDSYDARNAEGSWRWVVGGTPLSLVMTFGSCFEGGTGDPCGYAIGASAAPGPGGVPAPTDASLLALFRSTGTTADGNPTWVVVDAVVVRPPDRVPALLQLCDGSPSVAIYPAPGAAAGATIPAQAAWGANAAATALVEVDPAALSCAAMGD